MRTRYSVALALAMAAAVLLRWHGLLTWPLTFDEGASWYFAHLPLGALWGPRALLETNPPLFYGLEHLVLGFGGGPGTLRLLPALAGVLCVPAAAAVAATLGGAPAGVLAAVLVATSPVCIGASQDARGYALLTLAALLAILAELRLLSVYAAADRRPARRWWVLYVVASIVALYVHNTALLMTVALNLVALPSMLRKTAWRRPFTVDWVTANAVVAMAYALWVPVVIFQTRHTLSSFWLAVPSLADLRYAVMNVYAEPDVRSLQPVADLLMLAAGFAGIVSVARQRAALGLGIFVVAGVPAMTWLVSQWRPIMNGKTLLWLVPVFLVFAALGCMRARRFAWPAAAVLIGLQAAGCAAHFRNRWDEAFPEVASVLAREAQPGDAIYLDPPSQAVLLDLYGWPRNRLKIYVPAGPDPWFRDAGVTTASMADLAHLPAMQRLWVVTRGKPAEQQAMVRLFPGGRQVEDARFGHGMVRNSPLRNLEISLLVARIGPVSGLPP